MSSTSLRKGLNTLPQEIFDMIHNDVFTAPPGVRNLNDSATGLSMNLLHVSRDTREQYAKTFYNAEFNYDTNMTTFLRWLELLPADHRNRMLKITKGGDHMSLWHTAIRHFPTVGLRYAEPEGMDSRKARFCARLFIRNVMDIVGGENGKKAFLRHEGTLYHFEGGQVMEDPVSATPTQ